MSSHLNVNLLFKKYSEYFDRQHITSASDALDDKLFTKDKAKMPPKDKDKDKDKPKGDTLKLKTTKTFQPKTGIKNNAKESLTDTKKTKNTNSTKVTPREDYKLRNTIRQPKKTSTSVTPDKSARKNAGKSKCMDLFVKLNPRHKKKPCEKTGPMTQREREIQSLTDRNARSKSKKSRSKSKENTARVRLLSKENTANNRPSEPRSIAFKKKHFITIKTEYSPEKEAENEDSDFKRILQHWLDPFNEREKIVVEEIYSKEESYVGPVEISHQTPAEQSQLTPVEEFRTPKIRSGVMNLHLKTPTSTNKEELLLDSQRPLLSAREEYFMHQLERIKLQEEVRWQRTIEVLKELKESGNREMLDQLIGQSEKNRQRLRGSETFEKYKSIYDEDIMKERPRMKEGVDSVRSRQASSKKLLEDLEQAEYNQIQLEQHFQYIRGEESLNSTLKNINIGEYINEIKRTQETSKQPDFEQFSIRHNEEDKSQVNSLIQLIKHDLEDNKKNHHNSLVQEIVDTMMVEFAVQLLNTKDALHSFLRYTNFSLNPPESNKPQNQQLAEEPIKSTNSFVLDVTKDFLGYIRENGLEGFNRGICVPFGERPDKMLRYLREIGDQNKSDNESRYQSIIPVNTFIQFEPVLKEKVKMSSTISQYFFNHCIFDCINENLDRLRPFSLKGLPPLCFKEHFQPPKFVNAQSYINQKVQHIVSFGIGREIDEFEEQDAFRIIDSTFRKLDKITLMETDIEWNDNSDLEFEMVYDLAASVIDWLFKDEARKLYSLLL